MARMIRYSAAKKKNIQLPGMDRRGSTPALPTKTKTPPKPPGYFARRRETKAKQRLKKAFQRAVTKHFDDEVAREVVRNIESAALEDEVEWQRLQLALTKWRGTFASKVGSSSGIVEV